MILIKWVEECYSKMKKKEAKAIKKYVMGVYQIIFFQSCRENYFFWNKLIKNEVKLDQIEQVRMSTSRRCANTTSWKTPPEEKDEKARELSSHLSPSLLLSAPARISTTLEIWRTKRRQKI